MPGGGFSEEECEGNNKIRISFSDNRSNNFVAYLDRVPGPDSHIRSMKIDQMPPLSWEPRGRNQVGRYPGNPEAKHLKTTTICSRGTRRIHAAAQLPFQ